MWNQKTPTPISSRRFTDTHVMSCVRAVEFLRPFLLQLPSTVTRDLF